MHAREVQAININGAMGRSSPRAAARYSQPASNVLTDLGCTFHEMIFDASSLHDQADQIWLQIDRNRRIDKSRPTLIRGYSFGSITLRMILPRVLERFQGPVACELLAGFAHTGMTFRELLGGARAIPGPFIWHAVLPYLFLFQWQKRVKVTTHNHLMRFFFNPHRRRRPSDSELNGILKDLDSEPVRGCLEASTFPWNLRIRNTPVIPGDVRTIAWFGEQDRIAFSHCEGFPAEPHIDARLIRHHAHGLGMSHDLMRYQVVPATLRYLFPDIKGTRPNQEG